MTEQVRAAAGVADPDQWLAQVGGDLGAAERDQLAPLLAQLLPLYRDRTTADGEDLFGHCSGCAAMAASLHLGVDAVAAALASGLPRVPDAAAVRAVLPPGTTALLDGLGRMEEVPILRVQEASEAERRRQLEVLRRMFLAMVTDLRAVLLKLADQTQRLRFLAARGTAQARLAVARETFDLFAPLANRLGVWQLKWELEDLAFRCSEPEAYRRIARGLDETRADREAFIARVTSTLREELAREGLRAEVYGRPKHIYSIHQKLHRKHLELAELSDVRAVRVLVDDVRQCYTALGLVHSLWAPLPGAFDDYIAQPKRNRYRSLHTAVVGPGDKVLEVQIRTREMHQECEYGVAAHWRYKEGGGEAPGDERIAWLRRLLEWREELGGGADPAEQFRSELRDESIYVLTPQGRVINLPRGSTPVDFAYHVHSDLGHRCRGARVDGSIVALDQALANGQTVEIIAARSGGPSLDWLNPDQGIVHSPRARAKIRQWFNNQNLAASIAQGRQLVERYLARAGLSAVNLEQLAQRLGFGAAEDMLAAAGRGELGPRQVEQAARGEPAAAAPVRPPPMPVAAPASAPDGGGAGLLVVGVDRVLTVLAGCCKPVPPDPILGFVSRGRGVTVHRVGCPNLRQLDPQRIVSVQWGPQAQARRVDLELEGSDGPGLMGDVLDLLSRERVRVASASSRGRRGGARLSLTLEVDDGARLARLVTLLEELPEVHRVWRRGG